MTMKTNEQLKERKTNQNNKQRHDFILSGYLSMVIDRLLWLLVAVYIDFLCKIIFSPHNNRKIEKHLASNTKQCQS